MGNDEKDLRVQLTPEAKKTLEFWATMSDKTRSELASYAIMAKAPHRALELTDDFMAKKRLQNLKGPGPERVKGNGDIFIGAVKEAVKEIKEEQFHSQWVSDETEEELLGKTDNGIPLKDDLPAQELIIRWTAEGKSSRYMGAKLNRGKTAINNWRAKNQ